MAENSDLNGVLESKETSEDQHLEDANGSNNSSASSHVSDNSHHHLPVCRETIMLPKHIFEWSVADVGHWLTLNHFTAYNELLCERHRIDGRVLVSLSATDLRAEPLSLTVFGDVKRLCLAISAVREYYSTVGSGDEDSEEVVLKHGHGHGHRKLTRPNRKSAKYNTKSHQVSDPNRPSRERISARFRNGKVAPPLQNYPSVMGKSQSFPSYPRKQPQQQSQLQPEESTEDDYDLEPNGTEPLMYDEDDDGEDEIDEVEVLQEASGQQQYLTRPAVPGSYPAQYTAASADITPPNYYQTSAGGPRRNSLSGSVSDSSSLSDSSEDSRQSSGSTSSTSISKCNSESTVSTAYPVASGTQEPIPINVYVQPQGSTGRPIAAQIIPKLTTSNQLANMANYYSQPPNAAPMFYQTGHQTVPPPTYPSHSSYGAPASQTKKRSKGHHGHHHSHHRHGHGHHHHRKAEFKPEAWKAIVAMIYFFASTWVTAIVMVIVHDRVPDMDTYPPLPDILLDNLPLIPWAFGMCEFCGLVLFIIWSTILIFHKHRFILLRRMFSLFGSVFLLRCVTMLITSLSVPGRHLECKARPYGSWMERIHQAYLIWQGGGMSIQGVRTCGDYMFSGHTVVLTLMNFFITEYTPTKYYLVHTLSWVLNLFGIFFILAAHEHYSIDVFIAFYISTRLFLYYHTLANNRALYQRDRHRTRIWFPLFYFFESSVNGIVPNTYEVPFRKLKDRMVTYLSAKFSAGLAFGVPGLGAGDRRHLMEDAAAASSASGSSSSSAGGPGSKVKTQ